MSKFKSKADLESSVFADKAFRERLEGDDSVLLASRHAGNAEDSPAEENGASAGASDPTELHEDIEESSREEEEADAEAEAEAEAEERVEAEEELDSARADESAEELDPAGSRLSRRERRHELRLLRRAQSKRIDQ